MTDESRTIELPDPEYALIKWELDELPAIVVVNRTLATFMHQDLFAHHLSLIIECVELGDNGMPTPSEVAVVDSLGDAIEEALEEATTENGSLNVLFLAQMTWNGQREIVYYVHDAARANDVLQALIASGDANRSWDFEMMPDPVWKNAVPFLKLLDQSEH